MTETKESDKFTLFIARDYDTLDRLLRSPPTSSKPALVEFVQSNGHVRYIQPPQYREDGTCYQAAVEHKFDQATRKWIATTYLDTVAKHVVRVKLANGHEYPFTIHNIKERDLKDELFLQGVLFDKWEPYLKRAKAK